MSQNRENSEFRTKSTLIKQWPHNSVGLFPLNCSNIPIVILMKGQKFKRMNVNDINKRIEDNRFKLVNVIAV